MEKEITAIPGAGAIIERTQNGMPHILLQERRKEGVSARENGLLEIPAGKIRAQESIFDTIRREVREETSLVITHIGGEEAKTCHQAHGYTVLSFTPFSCSQNLKGEYPIMVSVFLCQAEGTLLAQSDEARNYRWASLAEVQRLVEGEAGRLYPMHVDTLRKYVRHKSAERGCGWELPRRMHFDEIVTQYDSIRPDYPAELMADVFAYAGVSAATNALEIGAGTGKATAPFLDAGCRVTAIEIGENMASFLRERFRGRKGFSAQVASFEDAALEDGCYDLIYAATAFHWVDAQIGCPRALRLLRSGGAFALFRYNAVPDDGNALYEDIQAVYERHYHQPYKRPQKKAGDALWQPDGIRRGFGFEDMGAYGFTDLAMKLYPVARTFTADAYIATLETFSDHRALPEADRAALYSGVRDAIAKHGGMITVQYIFQLYMGRKP